MKAIFLWKENESSDTVEMMLPLCMERARELGWKTRNYSQKVSDLVKLGTFVEKFGGPGHFDRCHPAQPGEMARQSSQNSH